jgi:hypothetical protein
MLLIGQPMLNGENHGARCRIIAQWLLKANEEFICNNNIMVRSCYPHLLAH